MIDPETGRHIKTRFTALKISEVSAVDSPAQAGALAVIMKRRDPIPNKHPFQKKEEKPMQSQAIPFAKANANFMGRVNAIAARDRIPHYQAMSKARQEYPDEFLAVEKAKFEVPDEDDDEELDDETAKVVKAEAVFNGKVAEIAKRDGCATYLATIKAREEHPDLFEAAYC